MTGKEILQSDLLDILFDNRNKNYGAYTLRKYYPGRLTLSLALALSSVFLLFLFKGGSGDDANKLQFIGELEIKSITIPKDDIPKPVQPKERVAPKGPVAPQIKYTDRISIVDRKLSVDEMPPHNQMDDLQIGDQNKWFKCA